MAKKVITVAQQKGGSGKTTLAANLAVEFSKSGCKVAILDIDPQGSLGRWYMQRLEHLGDKVANIGFRTASAWGARYETRELLKTYDIVIIDTPPKMGVDGRPAVEVADIVLVPIMPSQFDLWATSPILDLAKSEKKPVLAVLNRASRRTNIVTEIMKELNMMDCQCAETIIGNRIIFAETSGSGQGVTEYRPSSAAALEIVQLTGEITKIFKE